MAGFVIRDIWLLLCYYCMRQLRVVQRSLTGQSILFEVTHWCKRLSSTGLLQRPTDRSSAADIHSEYRSSSHVRSMTPDRVTPFYENLHWLPVRRKIVFWTAVLV